jgi:AraC-like DNA-binding protein
VGYLIVSRHTGRTFPQHVNDRRIRLALIALLTIGVSCQTVALKVGYRRPSDFAREFRLRIGCPPATWHRVLRLAARRHGHVDLAALVARVRRFVSR